jgi:hypothetical protein
LIETLVKGFRDIEERVRLVDRVVTDLSKVSTGRAADLERIRQRVDAMREVMHGVGSNAQANAVSADTLAGEIQRLDASLRELGHLVNLAEQPAAADAAGGRERGIRSIARAA